MGKNLTGRYRIWNRYIYIYIYDFPQYETIRSLGDSNCTGKNNTDETEINLLEYMGEFTNKSRRRKKRT